MTIRISAALMIALFSAAPALAEKAIIKWVDEKGVTHFGDHQPASQTKQGSQRINAQGIVVSTQENQLNAAAAAEAKKRAEAAKREQEKRALADRLLLDKYASEDDITRSYQQNVELLAEQIRSTTLDIDARQKGLARLVSQAGEFERAAKPVPEQIKTLIVQERGQIDAQRKFIAARKVAQATAKVGYDADLARYRAVLARVKK